MVFPILLVSTLIFLLIISHGETSNPKLSLPAAPVPVAVGRFCFFAVEPNGEVTVWGSETDWIATKNDIPYQERQTVFEGAISVWAGWGVTFVLDCESNLWCWGNNVYGQGMPASAQNWTRMLSDVHSMSMGSAHCVALQNDGTVLTWGMNQAGQLGIGTQDQASALPVTHGPQPVFTGACDILAMEHITCAVTPAGDLYLWGGCEGDGQDGFGADKPQKIADGVAKVALASNHPYPAIQVLTQEHTLCLLSPWQADGSFRLTRDALSAPLQEDVLNIYDGAFQTSDNRLSIVTGYDLAPKPQLQFDDVDVEVTYCDYNYGYHLLETALGEHLVFGT